jgi:hypothetical protein
MKMIKKELTENETAENAAAEILKLEKLTKEYKQVNMSKNTCVVPNVLLRSGLFGMVEYGKRQMFKDKKIESQSDYEISYTGEELDQNDLSVYIGILKLACEQANEKNLFAETVLTTHTEIINILQKSKSGCANEFSLESLKRLVGAKLEIKNKRYKYYGPLILGLLEDKVTQKIKISFNEKIAELFLSDDVTFLNNSIRLLLAKKQLALWTHGYYSSHAHAFPIYVKTLHALCGSNIKSLKVFRSKLKVAATQIEQACEENRQSFILTIDKEDKIYVEKTKTLSQIRHVQNNGGRKRYTEIAKVLNDRSDAATEMKYQIEERKIARKERNIAREMAQYYADAEMAIGEQC